MTNVISKLQREAFVLSFEQALTTAPQLDGYAVKLRNDHEIEVEVAKGQGLNRMFMELSAQSLRVSSMRTKTNRLEELFMRLVENKEEESSA